MQHSDFKVGEDFFTAVGRWRCTDVGQRTIVAVRWPEDMEIPSNTRLEDWLKGPPHVLEEVVFDEKEMALAYRTIDEAVARSLQSAHPGFSQKIMSSMMEPHKKRLERQARAEPTPAIDPAMKALSRYERIVDGRVLRVVDWSDDGKEVKVLDVYAETFTHIPVADFLAGRVAGEEDYAARSKNRG